jgi:hypothetical protein
MLKQRVAALTNDVAAVETAKAQQVRTLCGVLWRARFLAVDRRRAHAPPLPPPGSVVQASELQSALRLVQAALEEAQAARDGLRAELDKEMVRHGPRSQTAMMQGEGTGEGDGGSTLPAQNFPAHRTWSCETFAVSSRGARSAVCALTPLRTQSLRKESSSSLSDRLAARDATIAALTADVEAARARADAAAKDLTAAEARAAEQASAAAASLAAAAAAAAAQLAEQGAAHDRAAKARHQLPPPPAHTRTLCTGGLLLLLLLRRLCVCLAPCGLSRHWTGRRCGVAAAGRRPDTAACGCPG